MGEARLVSPVEKNILDANVDDLNEAELEEYLAASNEVSEKTQKIIKEADQESEQLQSKIKELKETRQDLVQKIAGCDQELKMHQDDIAVIDARTKKRDEEYQQGIHEILKPLYTGEVTHLDLSKVSDDPWFQETIRRGNQQKVPTSGSEQHTPPSSERHPVSSNGNSTPPSKASRSNDLSRQSSSLSLSSRSDSDSGDEKQRSKDSPQSPKPTLSSQAMVSVALPPAAVVVSAPKANIVNPSTGAQLPGENKIARPSEKDSKQQTPAVTSTATKAPAPQQKGLFSKLFNKNKSAPQQQSPATPGVVPAATTQQRMGH